MVQQYGAFISYSHSDTRFAQWLHARLETYRFPKMLVGRETPRGPVPGRLPPIFRDREELPASTSLSEEVRAALAHSDALIVVCSPAAVASRWVNREIELFRDLRPDKPILLALVSGDPDTAFPPALFVGEEGAEPLAADFGAEGDGRRLGLLKHHPGLSGVPLADLVQRDAQRKMRRVMAVTALAAVLVAIMAAMTMVAIRSRNEAERQRAESEDLVRFMVTDLRDRLDDAGRLDLLTVANDRALDYYRAQDLSTLDAQSLALRSPLLHAWGEDHERSGDLAGALSAFEEAAETTRALLETEPDNPDLIYTDAQSSFWVGFAAWRELRIAKAAEAFERYRALSDRLVAIDPANQDWRMEAGYAASNLGTVFLRTSGKAGQALQQFEDSLAQFETVLEQDPDNADIVWEVSDAHAWIADSFRILGRFGEARAARAKQAELLRRLVALDPMNAEYQRKWMGYGLGLALIERDAGKTGLAARLLRENYALAARHAASDPANTQLAIQRATALIYLHELDPAGAAAASDEPACGFANQSLDPELALLCGRAGEEMMRNDELEKIVCRLSRNQPTPRLGIALTEVEDLDLSCGDGE